jgi:hypothetical protein
MLQRIRRKTVFCGATFPVRRETSGKRSEAKESTNEPSSKRAQLNLTTEVKRIFQILSEKHGKQYTPELVVQLIIG